MAENDTGTMLLVGAIAIVVVMVLVKVTKSIARSRESADQRTLSLSDLNEYRKETLGVIRSWQQAEIESDTDLEGLKQSLERATSSRDSAKLFVRRIKQTMQNTRAEYTRAVRKRSPAVRGRGSLPAVARFFQARDRHNLRSSLADELYEPQQMVAAAQEFINEADAFILRARNRIRELKQTF